jgi:5-oxoprolinase (ATP-hydrolysing)
MTNTRVTDPEVLERRLPVMLRRFGLRAGSGGAGRFRGGDGVVRELQFRRSGLLVSILSERRAVAPWGAAGGGDGARGRNTLRRAPQNRGAGAQALAPALSLGGKASLAVGLGDVLCVETPGGGGWGAAGEGEAGGGAAPRAAAAAGVFVPRASGSLAEREATEADF